MSDFLDDKKAEIAARLDELRPYVDEYARLEAAAAALDALGPASAAAPSLLQSTADPRRSAPRKARRAAAKKPSSRRRSPSRGGGTRAGQALELVRARPGITIPEIAAEMGIKQNYLYRVLPQLEAAGEVRKDGRGWRPAVVAPAPTPPAAPVLVPPPTV